MTAGPFVVVGEALVDIVVPVEGPPVTSPGGSPLNVAVGLSRLDIDTVLVTQLGDDEHGHLVARHVAASNVQLAEGALDAGRRTNTATARLDEHHAATYDFDLTWDLPPRRLPEGTAGLHVGSLGAALRPGRLAVLDLVSQVEEGFVSYDPNVRSAFVADPAHSWRDLVEVAGRARLVKCSEEDLAVLRPGEPEEALVRELLAADVTELVVVTKGAEGASASTSTQRVDVPAPATQVVDTVGAGDSFMAALLAVLTDWGLMSAGEGSLEALDEDHVRLLLQGAVVAAAVTCSRRGANPPTRRELPPTWPAA
jgi:fructokinase